MRVEKAWNKKGLVGLRSSLLRQVSLGDWVDEDFVKVVSIGVFSVLPHREWSIADDVIRETCGLFDIDSDDHSTLIMEARIAEETLREDIGDE